MNCAGKVRVVCGKSPSTRHNFIFKENVKMTKAITKNSKKGFTLVELVVVIAILAILAAIAIPVVSTIISTASKNAALTDSQTIELAIKEAQADFVAKNPDTYPGIANSTKPLIQDVMDSKKIEAAFEAKVVKNKTYIPCWDKTAEKVVFAEAPASPTAGAPLTTGALDVEGKAVPNATNTIILATTSASGTVSCANLEVVSWATGAGSALGQTTTAATP